LGFRCCSDAFGAEGVGASHHRSLLRDIPDENHAECETCPRPRPWRGPKFLGLPVFHAHAHGGNPVRGLLRLKGMLRGAAWSRPRPAAAGRGPCGRTLRRQFALAPAIASLVCIPGFLPQACSGFTMPALEVESLPPLRARLPTCPRACPRAHTRTCGPTAPRSWRSNVIMQFRKHPGALIKCIMLCVICFNV
jgi:hypothetical protein